MFNEMNDKWHFRVWRVVMAWIAAWVVVMTADEMIRNTFPWSWMPPIMLAVSLFYLFPNTTTWHLVALGDWFFEFKSSQAVNEGLTPIAQTCFGISTGTSFLLFGAAMIYAGIADDFPWAAAVIVLYVLLTFVLLEMRVRYVLRVEAEAPNDATDRA